MNSGPGTSRRSITGWRIGAWLGVLLTTFTFFTSGWRDAFGFALATVAMFISAREDFSTQTWTKVATLGLTVAAVAMWILL
jgi:hypothetical protein